jgi:hypothetical protein
VTLASSRSLTDHSAREVSAVNIALAIAALQLARNAATEGAQAPPAPSCLSYTRESPATPEPVRAWLAHSRDHHVLVCAPRPQGGAIGSEPLYSGESAVTKAGGVCRYATHLLARTGAGAMVRLQRYEATEAVAMAAVGDAACPPPHDPATPKRYTMTYDLPSATFESLMAFWGAAATSAAEFDRALACCGVGGGPETAGSATASAERRRLRAAIAAGHIHSAAVTRIVRLAAHGLNRRYTLFIDDPESPPGGARIYVIYVSRFFRGPWHISGISDAAP